MRVADESSMRVQPSRDEPCDLALAEFERPSNNFRVLDTLVRTISLHARPQRADRQDNPNALERQAGPTSTEGRRMRQCRGIKPAGVPMFICTKP